MPLVYFTWSFRSDPLVRPPVGFRCRGRSCSAYQVLSFSTINRATGLLASGGHLADMGIWLSTWASGFRQGHLAVRLTWASSGCPTWASGSRPASGCRGRGGRRRRGSPPHLSHLRPPLSFFCETPQIQKAWRGASLNTVAATGENPGTQRLGSSRQH